MTEKEEAQKLVDEFFEESDCESIKGTAYYYGCLEIAMWLIEKGRVKGAEKKKT